MNEKIRVILPEKYDLVVGDTFQLFYKGVVEAPNPFIYDILAVCEKGKNYPRYYEFLPEEEGEYKLSISVFSNDKTLLGYGETILNVALPKQPENPVNILCIGDSITLSGEWVGEAKRRLMASDGTPVGNGLKNINFIGTCENDGVFYEGYGGWRWENYFSTVLDSMWVVCDNDKTYEDQHTLWQDENGNLWELETIAAEYLKFNRYNQHSGKRPESGILKHYKNAVHQSDIIIQSSSDERKSPFFDANSKEIDFNTYCERNGFEKIDAMYVLLGANGLVEAYCAKLTTEEHCRDLVVKGKRLSDLLHKAFPNAKIKIMGLFLASQNGGAGANHGAEMPCCDDYGYTRYVFEYNKAFQEWALEPEYKDFVEFVNVSGQFDSDYNFPSAEKPVNTRSKQTEIIGTNAVHPLYEGYMQIADAAYRNMVHFCKEN